MMGYRHVKTLADDTPGPAQCTTYTQIRRSAHVDKPQGDVLPVEPEEQQGAKLREVGPAEHNPQRVLPHAWTWRLVPILE